MNVWLIERAATTDRGPSYIGLVRPHIDVPAYGAAPDDVAFKCFATENPMYALWFGRKQDAQRMLTYFREGDALDPRHSYDVVEHHFAEAR